MDREGTDLEGIEDLVVDVDGGHRGRREREEREGRQ